MLSKKGGNQILKFQISVGGGGGEEGDGEGEKVGDTIFDSNLVMEKPWRKLWTF